MINTAAALAEYCTAALLAEKVLLCSIYSSKKQIVTIGMKGMISDDNV